MKHPVDVYVGKRVRHRRWMLNMTQAQLADKVGIKFQQIQKYETGANRISASRLWDIGQGMNVPAAYFFDGFEEESRAEGAAPEAKAEGAPKDILTDREAMQLIRSYYAIPEGQRKQVFELARVLGQTGG
ncbi:helix-turn-helix transcriptional regulator [Alphaproteobacteria bacterium KMM 3653]|uniref:Helix-turn-helix transcriptional regulator n=1 Tax=Harenicola maris TaxID=2841044 RepID=A0AAP2CPM0_9RHOB|nr:helix-turn-helix transcriptional regulator [Harenicola maris]